MFRSTLKEPLLDDPSDDDEDYDSARTESKLPKKDEVELTDLKPTPSIDISEDDDDIVEILPLETKNQEPAFSLITPVRTPMGTYHYRVTPAPDAPEIIKVKGEPEGIPLDLLNSKEEESWMSLLSGEIPEDINGIPPSRLFNQIKKSVVGASSVVTPAAFALNAFVGLTGLKLENLSVEEYMKLGLDKKLIAWVCGGSSELINALMNMDNIPKAFECLANLKNNFGNNPGRNALILLLTCGGAIAAGSIGFTSFGWAGTTIATLNASANSFLSFVTRFYGLMNLSKRWDHYCEQGKFEELLERLATDETALNELADTYTHELNNIIAKEERKEPIDRETVFDLLSTLFTMLKQNPDIRLKERSFRDKFGETLNWAFATLAALSVVPIFAQKFLDGMSNIEGFVSGTTHIADSNIHVKQIAGVFLGSATPLMYLNGVSQLIPTLMGSWDALLNSSTPCWRKLFSPFVFLANLAASISGYNLAKGVAANPKYIFKDFIAPDSTADLTDRITAAIATAGTNGPFAARTILPAPTHEAKEEKKPSAALSDTAALLQTLASDSAKWMKKNPLTQEGVEELNKHRKSTARTRARHGVTSASTKDLVALASPHDVTASYFRRDSLPGIPEETKTTGSLRSTRGQ